MKKAFWLKEKTLVDLYYNDLYALESSIEHIEASFENLEFE